MKKITVAKGQALHKKGEIVQSLEIVLSGALLMTDGNDVEVRLESGTLAGAVYKPGEVYTFDYVGADNTLVVQVDYKTEEDIAEAVTSTPAIAPVMASASMHLTKDMLDKLSSFVEDVTEYCKDLRYKSNDYKFLCVKLGKNPDNYPFIENLQMPDNLGLGTGWEDNVCQAFCAQNEVLKNNFYSLDINFCVAAVMMASRTGQQVRKAMEDAAFFMLQTKAAAESFVAAYYDAKTWVDATSMDSTDKTSSIDDAIDVILAFSGVTSDVAESFKKDIKKFTDASDRRGQGDDIRGIRQNITKLFYEIYEKAFFKSLNTSNIPVEVRMFFLFGFVDENLAGKANTDELYKLAVSWHDDPNGLIVPMYDWLVKIYRGEALPSKNEFDIDWPGYLREQVRTNAITQQEADKLQDDKTEMVKFEINNMFKSGNRITKGIISTFVPVFNAQDVNRALDKCCANPTNVQAAFDKVLDIDFGCFYREVAKDYPEYKVQRFVYNVEVRPYVILMPNFGSRNVMWQEIEGARRTTPAHMMLSVFHSEDLEETVVNLCAQFRWEMCRRIQGVRYTDISDKSLTSEYVNYLQFYKKNGNISNEIKEQIKLSLDKARNNYKNVFIAEYKKYILNEAYGLPKLNKIARDILFRYCTLSKKFRQSLATNPQFKPLFERWGVKQGSKVHNVELFIQKIQKMKPGEEVPSEITSEAEFLRR